MRFIASVLLLCTLASASESSCTGDGTDYKYEESTSGTTRTISNNNCPNHGVKKSDKIESTYKVPQSPMYDPGQQIDLSAVGNTIGIIQSGAQVFSPYIGGGTVAEDYATTATALEGDKFDPCGGHMNAAGTYHIHVPPSCLLRQKGMAAGHHSPQIGWAADGFPIYGPLGPSGTVMKTCTVTGGTEGTNICTDACGGYYGAVGDGYMYRYYIQGEFNDGTCYGFGHAAHTYSEEDDAKYFPFSPYCLRGCCPSGADCDMMPNQDLPSCSSEAVTGVVDGFDTSYTLPALAVNPYSVNDPSSITNCDNKGCDDTCAYSDAPTYPAFPPSPPSPPPTPKPPPSPPKPPPPPPCESYCATNTKDWATKCGWGGSCAGCTECYYPPSPPSPPPCSSYCETNTNEDSKKCGWANCLGCGFCYSPPPSPPPPPPCLSWCEGNTNEEEKKCGWNNCAGCGFCEASAASALLVANPSAASFISLYEEETHSQMPPVAIIAGVVFSVGIVAAVVVGAVRRRRRAHATKLDGTQMREANEKIPLKSGICPFAEEICPAWKPPCGATSV